ncbi:9825_t:CDS:1 [Acaulospora morrowiae]|uniref:9825_t:CDS:1 n=1 Tax=Acaulospora morrowiae TaxID=94023 RepID=A0A9N8V5W5_9GLOM|nr:9825_t:CDS:1 [Acaulospora morrowiae]
MVSSQKRSSHRGPDKKSNLHLIIKAPNKNKSVKLHLTKKMRTSSQKFTFSSISSILFVMFAYLIIPTYSIPVPPATSMQWPSPSIDTSDDLNNNGTSSDGGGTSSSPNKMEVMNWILAAISIVIVVELIFWLFKCINMVRKGVTGGEDDRNQDNNGQSEAASNGLDDEELPPYDGLSLPKYCEAMETSNNDNEQLRSSPLAEDENSLTAVVAGQEDNNQDHNGSVEEINRISNQTSTVVVEMNHVSNVANAVIDDARPSSSTEEPSS